MSASGRIAQIDALRARAEALQTRSAADALSLEVSRLSADALGKADEKNAELQSLRREAAALQGQSELAQATIARLQQDIEKRSIRAPVSGTIGATSASDVGAFVAAGAVVARIVPSGRLKVVSDFLPARVLGRVFPGQTARMRLDGFPWGQSEPKEPFPL